MAADLPKKGDKADVRCGFTGTVKGDHDLGKKPDDLWCSGCQFYVCEGCDVSAGETSGPGHDVMEHRTDPDTGDLVED